MTTGKTDIYVFADWIGYKAPVFIGILSALHSKGRKIFSFSFDNDWLKSEKPFFFDPEIDFVAGLQYSNKKNIFGIFSDSMPDTWGTRLMKRREAILAKDEKRSERTLYELDFLLGVNDGSRMGGLRFKLDKDGPFLNDDKTYPTPPWTSMGELQNAIRIIESEKDSPEIRKWLAVLIAPGSSLGGARPKANVLDKNGDLWIAKFPSKTDTIDKAAWEYLAYQLASKAGIQMSECKIEKISGKHHTFFTKRFDRKQKQRVHFASAMTMTNNNEDTIKINHPSYLDIAEFIQYNEDNNTKELNQLWRRIVFNIAVSNTDDHLRNHGFLLHGKTWQLSPAYDINPSIDKDGLALNIDTNNNSLDFDLAKSVGEYFQLDEKQMNKIIKEVKTAVSGWEMLAKKIGISQAEQKRMKKAFNY